MDARPAPKNDLCSCKKAGAFVSRQDAVRALDRIAANPRTPYFPIGTYQCDEGVFHLTKTPEPTPLRRKT